MKLNCSLFECNHVLLWALLLFTLLVMCSSAAAEEVEHETRNHRVLIDEPHLFKLFDFHYFKTVFHKKYRSILDEMSRMRIFLATCLKSYISIIKYKLHESTSYCWINHMSDWTQEEWEQTLMKPLKLPHISSKTHPEDGALDWKANLGGKAQLAVGREVSSTIDQTDVEREMMDLDAKMQGNREDLNWREEKSLSERQRELDSTSCGRYVADLVGRVSTQTDRDEIRQAVQISQKMPPRCAAALEDSNLTSAQQSVNKTNEEVHHEQIYDIDHRECFNKVKKQEGCGSCYIFAAISVLECHYYKAVGERISFSEQYALDCANTTCMGGFPQDIIDFSSEYGIDLAENFPYLARARKCTFGKPIKNKESAGYLHVTGLSHRYIPLDKLQEEIINGPITIVLCLNADFRDYKGGINEMEGCVYNERNHAMVLVGHGRENDIDFWLVRNSHSDSWGENGYYRITHEALVRCNLDESYLVEADNVNFRQNTQYDLERIQRLRQGWIGTEDYKNNKKNKNKKKKRNRY